MATPCRATSRHLLAAPLTPPPCRASDATSLPAQAQTSTTKTKDRPTLRLEPGIPMADNMTISSWVHFPLPQSPFLYKDRGGSALRKRRHRWTTLYCDSEDEFNHVCILQFEDNMDYRHVSGGQGTRTGAQFGINDNTGGVGFEFEAFEADDGEPQRQISGLSHGWHLVTLVTGPHQDKLFVDGTVRVLRSLRPAVRPPFTPPAPLHSFGARRGTALPSAVRSRPSATSRRSRPDASSRTSAPSVPPPSPAGRARRRRSSPTTAGHARLGRSCSRRSASTSTRPRRLALPVPPRPTRPARRAGKAPPRPEARSARGPRAPCTWACGWTRAGRV